MKTGRAALIEQLLADNIHHMFGNPGTVEEGFLDALGDYPDMHYILGLEESAVVAMADGYARATGKPAVIQLHCSVGLGNGIGMLYQAQRGHAPLVVLAGDAGVRYEAMDAHMAADLVAMAEPVTKWAAAVRHPASLLRMLRRAIKLAATPPMGPVFLALPMDVLDAVTDEEIVPTSLPITRVAPDTNLIVQAASLLASAQKPLIVIGDGVAVSGAQEELTRVAELLGAETWGADSNEVNMSYAHPLFQGLLGHMFGEQSRAIISQADAVLICGTYVFPEVFPALSGVFAPGAKIIHIDLNAYEIAKNFPVTLGIVGDPKMTLGKLATTLQSMLTVEQQATATTRIERSRTHKEQEAETQQQADQQRRDAMPMPFSRFSEELAKRLPKDAIIFDEALTCSPDLVRHLSPTTPGTYFLTRSRSLGVGFPGTIGLKLAHPEKVVIGFSGDGGSMYTLPALWTAAHYKIGAKFVVCSNRSYEILKINIQEYWRERQIPPHAFPASFDLGQPELRFDLLAEAMGVRAMRVERPEQIEAALQQALADDAPFLIELVISSELPAPQKEKVLHLSNVP